MMKAASSFEHVLRCIVMCLILKQVSYFIVASKHIKFGFFQKRKCSSTEKIADSESFNKSLTCCYDDTYTRYSYLARTIKPSTTPGD